MSNEAPYYNESWDEQLGSKPVKLLDDYDKSDGYDHDSGLFYELENGKFAVVFERGCSCYCSSSDAMIEIHNTYEEAKKSFEEGKG